jgi:hypothetical protein
LRASKLLIRPAWSIRLFGHSSDAIALEERWDSLPWGTYQTSHFGPSLTAAAMLVVERLCRYSIFLEWYANGTVTLDLKDACNERLLVHHALMSLPDSGELEQTEGSVPPGYESCRLALIAYSLMVVFPFPLACEPYLTLVTRLKDALLVEYEDIKNTKALALWIVMIGGIAASGTQERYWYAELLGEVSVICGCRTWIEVLERVRELLWLDCFCEVEARKLWEEWCMLHARHTRVVELVVS